eukprot:TRINITY_DN13618_c0_g1_i1.p2 TRINITY_DN13618_c0_g1~~TRINITY_DN13618_c0_g1_i1.p2  ORF type:complete len:139 (-),score=35.17 TRINITY_DN13618_c0_g1_i1:93-509(-)
MSSADTRTSRFALGLNRIHTAIRGAYNGFHANIVQEVSNAVDQDAVVVVGMSTNPFVKKARQAIEKAGQKFTYLEYGGYLSKWNERLAIKMWSGWPTFPQVFVHGVLVGGNDDVQKLIASGEFQKLVDAGRAQAAAAQ